MSRRRVSSDHLVSYRLAGRPELQVFPRRGRRGPTSRPSGPLREVGDEDMAADAGSGAVDGEGRSRRRIAMWEQILLARRASFLPPRAAAPGSPRAARGSSWPGVHARSCTSAGPRAAGSRILGVAAARRRPPAPWRACPPAVPGARVGPGEQRPQSSAFHRARQAEGCRATPEPAPGSNRLTAVRVRTASPGSTPPSPVPAWRHSARPWTWHRGDRESEGLLRRMTPLSDGNPPAEVSGGAAYRKASGGVVACRAGGGGPCLVPAAASRTGRAGGPARGAEPACCVCRRGIVLADAKFCDECADPLSPGVPVAPSDARPASERAPHRRCAAAGQLPPCLGAFCDLVGFTPLSESARARGGARSPPRLLLSLPGRPLRRRDPEVHRRRRHGRLGPHRWPRRTHASGPPVRAGPRARLRRPHLRPHVVDPRRPGWHRDRSRGDDREGRGGPRHRRPRSTPPPASSRLRPAGCCCVDETTVGRHGRRHRPRSDVGIP